MNDGLPSDYVYGVVEDGDGYIWAYTENGVAKFDGYDWKVFKTKDGLPHNDVYYIVKDKWDRLWICSMTNRLAYIQNDSVHTVLPDQDAFVSRYTSEGKAILQLGGNRTAFADSSQLTLVEISGEYKELLYREHQDSLELHKAAIIFSGDNRYAINSLDSKLYTYLGDSLVKKVELKALGNYFEENNDFWRSIQISTSNSHGLVQGYSDDSTLVMVNLESGEIKFLEGETLGINLLADDVLDHSEPDYLYYNTSNEYVFFNQELEVSEIYRPSYIADRFTLRRLFIDSQGNRWIGTKEGGLFKFNAPVFKTELLNTAEINDIERPYKEIIMTSSGLIAISENLGLAKIEEDGLSRLNSVKGNQVKATLPYKNGHLIADSENLYWLDEQLTMRRADYLPEFQTNTITQSGVQDDSWPIEWTFKNLKSLAMDTSASILYTSTARVTALDINAGVLSIVKETRSRCLHSDSDSNLLWLEEGKTLQNWDGNKLSNVAEFPDIISGMYLLDKDRLLIGTENEGVYIFHKQEKDLTHVSSINYLSACIEHEGAHYLAGNNGLAILKANQKGLQEHYRYTRNDGLVTDEIQDFHILDGYLYAASHKGLMKINLSVESIPADLTRRVVFKSFSVGGFSLLSDHPSSFDYDQNNVEVAYHFNDYASNGDISYSYRLQPTEQEWRTTSDRMARYSDLKPGEYQFELSATDTYGNSYPATDTISFVIEQPWWQTTVFRVIAGLVLAVGIFYIFKRRDSIQKDELKKEKELITQFSSLKLESLRAQMNPHFIFNSLGSIQYYIQTNQVDEADEYLNLFAKLMRRYLDSAVDGEISINDELSLLHEYSSLELMRFEDNFKIDISMDELTLTGYEVIPSVIVQPFVENAINHGLQARKEPGGLLSVKFFRVNDTIHCIVSDNGVGMDGSKSNTTHEGHESRAIYNVEKRIDLLKSTRELGVTIDVRPVDPLAHYPGTIVEILIQNPSEYEV